MEERGVVIVGAGPAGLSATIFTQIDGQMGTNKEGIFACGEITPGQRHLVTAASEGASAGMAASEYLALQMVKKGEMFEGAKNGKYASEYPAMLS